MTKPRSIGDLEGRSGLSAPLSRRRQPDPGAVAFEARTANLTAAVRILVPALLRKALGMQDVQSLAIQVRGGRLEIEFGLMRRMNPRCRTDPAAPLQTTPPRLAAEQVHGPRQGLRRTLAGGTWSARYRTETHSSR